MLVAYRDSGRGAYGTTNMRIPSLSISSSVIVSDSWNFRLSSMVVCHSL
jgi:hypothetical protein